MGSFVLLMCCVFGLVEPTQADIINTAKATGDYLGQSFSSTSVTVSVPVASSKPAIGIVKTATFNDINGNGFADVNDTITYAFTVSNLSSVTLTNVNVIDNKIGAVTCAASTLTANQTTTCTGPAYHLLQSDVDAGSVANQATVTAKAPDGTVVSDLSDPSIPGAANNLPTVTPLVQKPAIGLVKTAGAIVDVNNNGMADKGDTIAYAFTVSNLGNVTLSGIAVSDPKVAGITCIATSLAPNTTTTCTGAAYVLTQADVDAGKVVNQAKVTANTPSGAVISDLSDPVTAGVASDNPTIVPIPEKGVIGLVKTAGAVFDANGNGVEDSGDTITYSFAVSNLGNVSLTNVSVSDSLLTGMSCPKTSLAPAEVMNCTATSYVLKQADFNTGKVSNQATASAVTPSNAKVSDLSDPVTPGPSANAPTVVTLIQNGVIGLVKTAVAPFDANGNGVLDAGDTITYSFKVFNLGNVVLNSISIVDSKVANIVCPPITLAPSANVTCSGDVYVISQSDIDTGQVSNTATVTGTVPNGTKVSDVSDSVTAGPAANSPTVTPLTTKPSMSVTKLDTLTGAATVGAQITYKFTVKNTGTASLHNISIADPAATIAGGPIVILAPGASDTTTFTATHTLTAADIASGSYTNTATATATPSPTGSPAITANGSATTTLNTNAAMTFTKSGILANGIAVPPKVGDKVNYTLVVTNTGLTPLSNVSVSDPLLASVVTPAQQQVALLDMVSGTDAPEFATAASDVAGTRSGIVAAANRHAHLEFTGEIAKADVLGVAQQLVRMSGATGDLQPGEKIGMLYSITNGGDNIISDIAVTQPDSVTFGGRISQLKAGDTDGSSMIFTREITAQEVLDGAIKSNAYLTFNQMGRDAIQTVTETLPLSGIKTYEDVATASISPTVVATLTPGQTFSFTAPYTLTQADIDLGTVHNLATANAKDSGGSSLIKTASFDLPLQQAAQIGMVKTGSLTPKTGTTAQVGDVIAYKFAVTNLGNVTLKNVTLTDPPVTLVGGPIATLAPGVTDSTTFTATYAVTQADIDSGKYQNQATVNGSVPGGASTSALSDNTDPKQHRPTIVPITPAPAIGLLKKVAKIVDTNNNGRNDVGDVIQYQFTVYNLGNVTLSNINIADSVGGGANVVIAGGPIVTLAPGATSTQITGSYAIVQSDMDLGHVDNTATATGSAPDGTKVSHDSDPAVPTQSSPTVTPLTQQAQVKLYKKLGSFDDVNKDGILDAGDVLHYTFTVENSGNVTLSNLQLTDVLAAAQVQSLAPGATLAPGAVNAALFTATYVVTVADEAAGRVMNRATITATQLGTANNINAISLSGDPSQSTDSTTDTLIHPTPSVAIELPLPSYTPSATNTTGTVQAGDVLTYKVKVKNTGRTPLNSIVVQDNSTGVVPAGNFVGTLLPNQEDLTSFTASYVLTAADIAAGIYKAQLKITGSDASGVSGGGQILSATNLSDPTDYTKQNPTVFLIAANPQISVLKTFNHFENAGGTIIAVPVTGAFVVYTITVANTGNVVLDNVTVAEVAGFTGILTGTTPFALAIGATDSTHFVVKHQLTNAEMLAGHVDNQVLATGTNTAKNLNATWLSDPNDPAQHNVTVTKLIASPSMAVIKSFTVTDANGNGVNDAGDTINYTFTVTNTGNIDLSNVTIADPAATLLTTGPIALLKVGQTDKTTFTAQHLIMLTDVAAGVYSNQATLTATEIPVGVKSDRPNSGSATPLPTVTALSTVKPILTKVAKRSQVKRGEIVPYIITASNVNGGPYQLVDIMPPGFSYVGGSALVNGAPITPVINATILTFGNLTPVNTKIILTLNLTAQASLSGGQFINNARLIDPATNAVLGVAQATVEVIPEATFDCSDVIGRVFDDIIGDGLMRDGNKGVAGVRLATVNGTLITTDAEGRFHIPCAAIPDSAIGSNFILKIDPRSLPLGYKITSENPRVVRLTRGKMTEINFGVARVHDVKVDLEPVAFDPNSADLTERWSLGIDRLVEILRKRRSDLTLVYHRGGESDDLAHARVAAVAAMVTEAFAAAKGGYELNVKTSVEQGR